MSPRTKVFFVLSVLLALFLIGKLLYQPVLSATPAKAIPPSAWDIAASATRAAEGIDSQTSKSTSVNSSDLGNLNTQKRSLLSLVNQAIASKRAPDLLAARRVVEICKAAKSFALANRISESEGPQRRYLAALSVDCVDEDQLNTHRRLLQHAVDQLPVNSDAGILARIGQLQSTEEQARAMRIAFALADPNLIAYVAGQGVSPEAYKILDPEIDLAGQNPYDRDMLALAWQVWACKRSGTCDEAMSYFEPCIRHGYCNDNLSEWPKRHLYGADSNYGFSADWSARGFTSNMREQRWNELYRLVDRVAPK